MEIKTLYAQDLEGNVIPEATVYIYERGTFNTISGLQDAAGQPLSNPFTADLEGRIIVAAPTGTYDMRVTDGAKDRTRPIQFLDAGYVNKRTIYVGSVAELEALSLAVGANVYLTQDGRAGEFVVKTGTPPSDPQKGIYIVLANGNYAERQFSGSLNIKWFGATGDGVADDSASIQAALNYAADETTGTFSVYIPHGDYIVGSTILAPQKIEILGSSGTNWGSRLVAGPSLNSDVISTSGGLNIKNVNLVGTYDPLNTSEVLLHVTGGNDLFLQDVVFFNMHTGILCDGTSAAFYLTIDNCRFQNSVLSFIRINETSNPGVDLIISNTRFLGNIEEYAWHFVRGLGSIIADNIQISLTGIAPSQQLVYFGEPAPLYGGAQFSNCVFEGGQFYIAGSATSPWFEMHFSTCLFTGYAQEAMRISYSKGVTVENSTFSTSSTSSILLLSEFGNNKNLRITDCGWETDSGTAIPINCPGDSIIDLAVVSPKWTGSKEFVNFSSITPNQLKIQVHGGSVGTNSTPIILPDENNVEKNISAFGYNFGPLQKKIYTGTLAPDGTVNITHGITNARTRVGHVSAWFRGGSGEMIPLSVAYVDLNVIRLTGGPAAVSYRAHVLYNLKDDTSW